MIKNGLIEGTEIYGVPFRIDLIPVSNKIARPAIPMIAEYLTIHNTGNSKKGADAEMHTEYVDTQTGYISWAFTVDDKEIIQELPINEIGWHSGDGRGTGNMKSIGIEICENEGIDWEKAKANAIKLIVFLIKNVSSLKSNPIKPHQFWSGKYCPHKILDEGWDKFINQVNQFNISISKPVINTIDDACKFLGSMKVFSDVSGWTVKAKADKNLADLFLVMAKNWDTMENTKYFDVILDNIKNNIKN